MDAAIEHYFVTMKVSPDLRERTELILRYFEHMTGSPAASALVLPARDFIGNPCHELMLFSDNALMNAGMLVRKSPSARYDVITYRGRVNNCLLTAKHFDPAAGETAPVQDASELALELSIHGRAKPIELRVTGQNCRFLAGIVARHIARNIV